MAGLSLFGGMVSGNVVGGALVRLYLDDKQFQTGMAKNQAKFSAQTTQMGAASSKFSSVAKVGLLAVGAAMAKMGADGVKALARIERINAQTTAAIKSTGGAANVTAEHVESLAGALENMTSIEAESIQEGANLLLTFKNIRNEVGKGNDIFDESTRLMVNMSIAMGQDIRSSALQMGKALNDPIRNMGALRRAGVQLTVVQEEQIETLVESNRMMDAQKIILGELRSEFGRSGAELAKTTEGEWALFMHSVGELSEAIASGLLPVIKALTPVLRAVVPHLDKVAAALIAMFAARGLPVLFRSIATSAAAMNLGTLANNANALATSLGAAAGKLGMVGAAAAIATPYVQRLGESIAEDLFGYVATTEEGLAALDARLLQMASQSDLTAGEVARLARFIEDYNVRAREAGFETRLSGDAILAAARAAGENARATEESTRAYRRNTEAIREQRLELLQLAGGFLAIRAAAEAREDAQDGLAAVQAKLNRLEENGKKGTEAYRKTLEEYEDAVAAVTDSQLSLVEAIETYSKELLESGTPQKEVIAAIRQMGKDAGLTNEQVRGLIREIKNIPKKTNTDLNVNTGPAQSAIDKFLDGLRLKGLELGPLKAGGQFHEGGPVPGSGEVIAALLGEEHVLTQKQVRAAGGHEAVDEMFRVMDGLSDYHSGGAVKALAGQVKAYSQVLRLMTLLGTLAKPEIMSGLAPTSSVAGWGLLPQTEMYARMLMGTFPGSHIISGRRSVDTVPGPGVSQHLFGKAVDISRDPWSSLWPPFWWTVAMDRAGKLPAKTSYMVLSAPGESPKQYSGGGISTPSAFNIGNHHNHIHWNWGKGGIATRAMSGTFGEAGPEAMVPLGSPNAVRMLSDSMKKAGGGTTVNVNVNAPIYGWPDFKRQVMGVISEELRRTQPV